MILSYFPYFCMNKKQYIEAKNLLGQLAKDWGKAKVYMVGGCVRDRLMNNYPKDLDLCIDLENGAVVFCDWLKQERQDICSDFVVYPRFGTSKFSLRLSTGKVLPIECVMPRTEAYNDGPRKPSETKYTSLEQDALRRDFCCNALYLDLETDEILDPTGHGISDLKAGILRTPLSAKETFIDDPLRMLRAFRFSARLGFTILPEVLEGIKPYPEYEKLSMERVADEFSKILQTSRAVETIRALHSCGLLGYIIPELEASWGFNQNSHYHSMNFTDHTLAVLQYVIDHGDSGLELRLAALLHDIAKPVCWKKKDNGEFSYHGHDFESANLSKSILSRLKFSGDSIKKVSELVARHMRIKSFYDPNTDSYTGSPKITRRVIRDLGDFLADEMKLIDADNHAHAPAYNMPGQVESFWKAVDNLGEVTLVRSCPVSGDVIMEKTGLKPGRVIQEIKDIFLDWLDENPGLGQDELFEKLREACEGNTFWAWFESLDGWKVSDNKPVLKESEFYFPDPYQVPMVLGEYKGLEKKPTQYRAIEKPILWLTYQRYKQAREIFDRAADVLDEMYKIPGFNGVRLTFDRYHDLSGEIMWTDRKSDWII